MHLSVPAGSFSSHTGQLVRPTLREAREPMPPFFKKSFKLPDWFVAAWQIARCGKLLEYLALDALPKPIL